jgi:hypothetical protein
VHIILKSIRTRDVLLVRYMKGDIYLPVWGPQTTTESRLVVLQEDIDTCVNYDHKCVKQNVAFHKLNPVTLVAALMASACFSSTFAGAYPPPPPPPPPTPCPSCLILHARAAELTSISTTCATYVCWLPCELCLFQCKCRCCRSRVWTFAMTALLKPAFFRNILPRTLFALPPTPALCTSELHR